MPRIILASASPRRVELLKQIVSEFDVIPADVDERALTLDDPWQTAQRLAEAKARAVHAQHADAIVIGADTVVAYRSPAGWQQLAKPINAADAERMLQELSGKEHVVITGVAIVSPNEERSFAETTRVSFRPVSEEEIHAYVATGEPMDKAGAYAIQGGAAGFVDGVEGLKSTVIGLPIERLVEAIGDGR